MDKKLKTRWLRALRSDRYAQGKRALVSKDGTQFCCLGVLADLQGCVWGETEAGLVPFMEGRKLPVSAKQPSDAKIVRGGTSYLAPRIFGISIETQHQLGSMNDTKEYSFKKIANWIEKHL